MQHSASTSRGQPAERVQVPGAGHRLTRLVAAAAAQVPKERSICVKTPHIALAAGEHQAINRKMSSTLQYMGRPHFPVSAQILCFLQIERKTLHQQKAYDSLKAQSIFQQLRCVHWVFFRHATAHLVDYSIALTKLF